MTGYSTRTEVTPGAFQLLKLTSITNTPILVSQSDYRCFLQLMSDCVDACNEGSKVLPMAYHLNRDKMAILVCSGGDAARTYVDNLCKGCVDLLVGGGDIVGVVEGVGEDEIISTSADIHTDGDGWLDYEFSSIRAYLYSDYPDWLFVKPIVRLRGSAVGYLDYLQSVCASKC